MKKHLTSFAFIFSAMLAFCLLVAYVVYSFFKRSSCKINLKYLP